MSKIFCDTHKERIPIIANGIITTSKHYCLSLSLLDKLLYCFHLTDVYNLNKKYNDKADRLLK